MDGSSAPEADKEKGPWRLRGTTYQICSFPCPTNCHAQPISKLSATSLDLSTSSADSMDLSNSLGGIAAMAASLLVSYTPFTSQLPY